MNRVIERIRGIPDRWEAWYELCKVFEPHSEEGLKEFALSNNLPVNGALHEGWLEYCTIVKNGDKDRRPLK